MTSSEPTTAFVQLKKRLELLNYRQPLGIESVPLVESLLSDLVVTSENYESLREAYQQVDLQNKQLSNVHEPVRRENARLTSENEKLHQSAIETSTQLTMQRRTAEVKMQAVRDECANLRFVNQQLEQARTEQEAFVSQLQQRLASVTSAARRARTVASSPSAEQSEPSIPPSQRQSIFMSPHRTTRITRVEPDGANDIVLQSFDDDALGRHQAQMAAQYEQLQTLQKQLSEAQEELQSWKDRALQRSEPATEQPSLPRGSAARDRVLDQLNDQVDYLNGELADREGVIASMRSQVSAVNALKRELDQHKTAREVAERRLEQVAAESASLRVLAEQLGAAQDDKRIPLDSYGMSSEAKQEEGEEEGETGDATVPDTRGDAGKLQATINQQHQLLQRLQDMLLTATAVRQKDASDQARGSKAHDATSPQGSTSVGVSLEAVQVWLDSEAKSHQLEGHLEQLTSAMATLRRELDDATNSARLWERKAITAEEASQRISADAHARYAEVGRLEEERAQAVAEAAEARRELADLRTESARATHTADSAQQNTASLQTEAGQLRADLSRMVGITTELRSQYTSAERRAEEAGQEVSRLKAELASWRDQAQQRGEEVEKQSQRVRQLEREVEGAPDADQVSSELSRLRGRCRELETALNTAHTEAAAAQNTLWQLRRDHDRAVAERDAGAQRITRLEQEVQRVTTSDASSSDELIRLTRALRGAEDDVAGLQGALAQQKQLRAAAEERLEALMGEQSALQQREMSQGRTMQELKDEVADLRAARTRLQGQVQGLEQDRTEQRTQQQRLEDELRSVQQACYRLEAQLSESQHDCHSAKSGRQTVLEELEAVRRQLREAEEEAQGQGQEVRNLRVLLSQQQNLAASLKQKLNEAQGECTAAEGRRTSLASEVDHLSKELRETKAALGSAREAVLRLDEERDTLVAEMDDRDLRIDELQRALESAETETDRLQAEAKNTKKSVHEQAGTNEALKRELTHLQQELQAYKAKLETTATALEGSRRETASAAEDLTVLQDENQRLYQQFTQSEQAVEQLETRVSELEEGRQAQQHEIRELRSRGDFLVRDLGSAQADLDDAQAEIEVLSDKLLESRQQAAGLLQECEGLQRTLKEEVESRDFAEATVRSLETQLKKVSRQLEALQGDLDHTKATAEASEGQAQQSQRATEHLIAATTDLRQRMAEVQRRAGEERERYVQAEHKLQLAQGEISELQGRLRAAEAALGAQRTRYMEDMMRRSERAEGTVEAVELRAKVQRLSEQLKVKDKEVMRLRAQISSLRGYAEVYDARISQVAADQSRPPTSTHREVSFDRRGGETPSHRQTGGSLTLGFGRRSASLESSPVSDNGTQTTTRTDVRRPTSKEGFEGSQSANARVLQSLFASEGGEAGRGSREHSTESSRYRIEGRVVTSTRTSRTSAQAIRTVERQGQRQGGAEPSSLIEVSLSGAESASGVVVSPLQARDGRQDA